MDDNGTLTPIEKLERERLHILEELSHLYKQINTEIEADVEGGDPELVDRDMAMALIRVQERKLNAIEQALADARQGTYGICERCGQPIAPERLEAIPETTLCIKCQTLIEKRHH